MNDDTDKRESKNPQQNPGRAGSAETGIARKSQAAEIAGARDAAMRRPSSDDDDTSPHDGNEKKRSEYSVRLTWVWSSRQGSETDGKAPASAMFPRHEQTFPALTPQEIARMRRFGEVRNYKHGEKLFETGKPGPGHVRRPVRPRRDHPARRPRPRHAGDRSGAGAVPRRNRPALRPRRAGRRPCRRRRRNAADPAGAVARAAGRGSRSRRAHHARADPAPGQPDPGRRRRPGADRSVEFERRRPPAGISHPQRLSASSARSGRRYTTPPS